MTKEEILNYVMNTPDNTNRMVLEDMLNELINSSGGNSNFFDVVFTYTRGEKETVVVSDKTYDEVVAAINAGKSLRAKLADSGWPSNGAIQDLSVCVERIDGDVDTMWFISAPEVDEDGVVQRVVTWSSDAGLGLIDAKYPSPESEPEPKPDPGPIS